MARIEGVDLPHDKRIEVGLTYIYGIGPTLSNQVISQTGVNPDTRVKDLTDSDVTKMREYINQNCKVEGDLRREEQLKYQAFD